MKKNKMKKSKAKLLILLLTGFCSTGLAQSIAPSTLNCSGGSVTAAGYIFEFNLGELVATGTAVTAGAIVTQGLLQPVNNLTSLPVALIRFQGSKKPQYNLLSWATSYENGNIKFELQRSSDGSNFTTIYTTPARGSANGNTYSYNDYQPFSGNIFYRLRIVEPGLADKYSQIIVLTDDKNSNWTVFPNPVPRGGMLNLNIQNAGAATSIAVRLTDALGRKVAERNEVVANGFQSISIPMQLPPGLYTFSIIGFNNSTRSQKIIVQ